MPIFLLIIQYCYLLCRYYYYYVNIVIYNADITITMSILYVNIVIYSADITITVSMLFTMPILLYLLCQYWCLLYYKPILLFTVSILLFTIPICVNIAIYCVTLLFIVPILLFTMATLLFTLHLNDCFKNEFSTC